MKSVQKPAAKQTEASVEERRSLRVHSWRDQLRPEQIGQKYAVLVAWVLVIILFGILKPDTFLSARNFSSIFGSQAVLVILTLGLVVPLTAGDYDLSIGSVLTLAAMLVAILNVQQHVPIVLAILAALAAGVFVGFLNGGLVMIFGIDPFIVTLGTGTFVSGIVFWISESNTISGISHWLVDAVINNGFLGISFEFYYGLLLCIVMWYVLAYTPVGRRLLFVGRGRSVARLSGLRVGRLRWGALVVSGGISALAGIVYSGTTGSADPTSGTGFLLPAFAAAFLGATTITPGRFNPWGALIAVYFLVTGITGLQLFGAQSFVQQLFYGGALVLAVALSQIARRREAIETN
jgi:ribose transport system permease protein